MGLCISTCSELSISAEEAIAALVVLEVPPDTHTHMRAQKQARSHADHQRRCWLFFFFSSTLSVGRICLHSSSRLRRDCLRELFPVFRSGVALDGGRNVPVFRSGFALDWERNVPVFRSGVAQEGEACSCV